MIAIGRRVTSERSAFSDTNPREEHRRAANGYLLWPLALANIIREDEDTTIWTRIHARQALGFGVLTSVAYVLVLALPLVAVLAVPSLSTGGTIGVYAAGLSADVFVGVALLLLAIRFAVRAARGDLFSIQIVTPLMERLFPIKQR